MKLEIRYNDTEQEKSENEDFIITKEEHFYLVSEHLASICYNSCTKKLCFTFESGMMMDIHIKNIDALRLEK